jgi:Icc-related predicted phosphoesterase
VYGSPWQPEFFEWAFNLTEPQLEQKWALIPPHAQVLVLHGPPYGYGDLVPAGARGPGHRAGSPSLLRRIEQVRPRLAVFGHIHEGRGRWVLEGQPPVTLANVTVVDAHYRPAYPPMEFELS